MIKKSSQCPPVSITLAVIGGKWKPLILYILQRDGRVRFNELNRRVTGITQKMLTQQLRELKGAGLVGRKLYPEVPPRVEYFITDYGKTLFPILKSMSSWGEKHRARYQDLVGQPTRA